MRLAREGMRVVINGRTLEAIEQTVAEFQAFGIQAVGIAGDVGRSEDVDRLFQTTVEAFGTVDLLVNNAADLRRSHFFEADETLLDDQLLSNIRGPYICSYRAAEIMRDQGSGSIIHISSVGGLRAHWRGLPYDMTKGALDALTRAQALELADYGIRVNAVAPGATRTERTPADDSPQGQATGSRVPLRRYGLPTEIGAAVAFLASPDAAYITGQVIYVDGGLTIQLGLREYPV